MPSLLLCMLGMFFVTPVDLMSCGPMRLVQLFGAIGTFEIMSLAGNGNPRNSHEQERKKFHRAAS